MAKGKTPKKKLNKKGRFAVAGIAVLLIAAIVIVILNLRFAGAGDKIEDEWQTPKYLRDKQINILVCGVDTDERRLENPDGQESDATLNTDVIMVVSIDLETNKATILQIPRDTYVGEEIVKYGKINGLYGRGYQENMSSEYKKSYTVKDKGMACLVETINRQMKLPIDNYVLITMEGFRKAVDMLGGIEVTLDAPLDFVIFEEDGKTIKETVTLEAGTHLLDGVNADMFVRYRAEGGDIARMDVQRHFLAALMNKALSMPKTELISLANAIFPYLETDFTISELLSLVDTATSMTSESITTVRVPGEEVFPYGIWGLSVWGVHNEELAAILNDNMRPYTDKVPAEELETIEIQNTTDDEGAEATLGSY